MTDVSFPFRVGVLIKIPQNIKNVRSFYSCLRFPGVCYGPHSKVSLIVNAIVQLLTSGYSIGARDSLRCTLRRFNSNLFKLIQCLTSDDNGHFYLILLQMIWPSTVSTMTSALSHTEISDFTTVKIVVCLSADLNRVGQCNRLIGQPSFS
jgi:hypothetical protein